MPEIRIAENLALPLDFVTQTSAILARRGAGKTYAARKIAEQVIQARQPIVILDPLGAFWGLRSSADGQSAGLPVVILGGEHGDVRLEPTAGKVIADVVVDQPGAYVIDLSGFESKKAEQRFAIDFLERLYRLKAAKRDALLLVVDEADVFAPQRPMGDEAPRLLGAMEAIVRRGRIRGLGVLLISQRAAVINKNVLTQTEVLMAMQTTGPQDRAALEEWIKGNGTDEERAAVLGSLASLERGEAWLWSPAWLRRLVRIRIARTETFDSSATPEAGQVAIEPKAFAKVDRDNLDKRIAETIERQKADDPRELKKRIRELEIQTDLQAKSIASKPAAEPEVRVERVEVPVLNGQVPALREAVSQLATFGSQLVEIASSITAAIGRVQTIPATSRREEGRTMGAAAAPAAEPRAMPRGPVAPAQPASQVNKVGAPLGKAERSILAALTQYPHGKAQKSLGVLTGYAWSGGGFNNAISSLRSKGLIQGGRDLLTATDAGRETADAIGVEQLPTGAALYQHWMGQLGKAERLILEALVAAYPRALDREELGDRTGYVPTGGGFNNALSRLRTLELIERGELRASADLFD